MKILPATTQIPALVAIFFLLSPLAQAGNTWDGGGATGDWSDLVNWDLDTTPVSPTALTFAGILQLDTNNDLFADGTQFNGIIFDATAGAFTLAGNSITLGGNITNNSTAIQTIDLDLLTTSVRTISAIGDSTTVINGDISGTGGGISLSRSSGTVSMTATLAGNNSHTGNTTFVANTILNINHSSALGDGVLVAGGNGSFDNTSDAPITISNAFNLSGGSPTFIGTNDLTISGLTTISGANRTLTVTDGTLTIGSVDADTTARTFTKAGAGTLQINSAAGANLQGGSTISGGTLIMGHQSALGSGNISFGAATIQAASAFTGANAIQNNLLLTTSGTGTTTIISGSNSIEMDGLVFRNAANNGGLTNALDVGQTLTINNIELNQNNTAARIFYLGGAGRTVVEGQISNGTGATSFDHVLGISGNVQITSTGQTYAGPTRIFDNGRLQIDSLSNIGAGALQFGTSGTGMGTLALQVDGSATFARDFTPSGGSITGIAEIYVDRATSGGPLNGIMTLGAGGSVSFNVDTGQFRVSGDNGYGLTLNQSMSWAGNNQTNKANIVNNAPGLLHILGNLTGQSVNNRSFEITGTGDIRVEGTITGSNFHVLKTGASNLTLVGVATPTGGGAGSAFSAFTVMEGTLQFATLASMFDGDTARWNNTTSGINVRNGATLALNVGGTGEFSTTDVATFLGSSVFGTNSDVRRGFIAGSAIAFDTTNASGGSFTIADTIANSSGSEGGAVGLTKLGTGILELTNNNTYTGLTTVSVGTLLINGNQSAATGNVVVEAAATLGGSGTIGGNVLIDGGILAPGNSADTLTLSNTNLTISGATSEVVMEILGTGLGDFDRVVGIDQFSLDGTLTLSLSGSYAVDDTWSLFSFSSHTGNFDSVNLTGDYVAALSRSGNLWTGTSGGLDWEFDQSSGFLTVIPEPSSTVLLILGIGGIALLRRRSTQQG